MRSFFHVSSGLAACTLAVTALAGAPDPQVSPGMGIEVQPIRFAGIDRDGHLITPWFYTEDLGGVDSPCGDDCIWDSFGYDTPDGGPNHSPSQFLNADATYCDTWSVNDFQSLAPGSEGALSDHAKFAWSWYGNGDPNGSEQCYLVTFTYEDFDDICTGPPASNPYDGIILDFGPLATNPGGFYITNVNKLCQSGLGYQMPVDGNGAYDLLMWNFYDGQNFAFATCGSPMFWHNDQCGTQSDHEYDDNSDIDENGQCTTDENGRCVNVPDGIIRVPFECYSHDFGTEGATGSMVAFLGNFAPASCIDLSEDQFIGGEPTTWTISNGAPNAVVALVYGLKAGTTNVDDVMGYCATFGIQGVSQSKVICQSKFDGAGNASCKKFIPAAFKREVFMQAAQRDTCPDECVSNILDLVVL